MSGNSNELHEAILQWATMAKRNAENSFTSQLFKSAAAASPTIDRASGLLLAGTGATAALMISNVDKLLPILTVAGIRQALSLLVVSALFGLLAKYKAVNVQSLAQISAEIHRTATPVLEEHAQHLEQIEEAAHKGNVEVNAHVDFRQVADQFVLAFPVWMRPFLYCRLKKSMADPLASDRMMMNGVFWQGNYAVLQSLAFVTFVVVTLLNIKSV